MAIIGSAEWWAKEKARIRAAQTGEAVTFKEFEEMELLPEKGYEETHFDYVPPPSYEEEKRKELLEMLPIITKPALDDLEKQRQDLEAEARRQAELARQGVVSQYGEAVGKTETQAAEARVKTAQQAEANRSQIRNSIGQAEIQIQQSLNDVRYAEQMRQRRRGLGLPEERVSVDITPLTKQQEDLKQLRREVDTAEASSLADIQSQIDTIMADLAKQKETAFVSISTQTSEAMGEIAKGYQEIKGVLRKLEDYKSGDGYDIIAAIESGISRIDLEKVFSPEQIQNAKDKIAEYSQATKDMAKYIISGGYDLYSAIQDKVSDTTLKNLFTDEQIHNAKDKVAEYEQSAQAMAKYVTEGGYDLYTAIKDKVSDTTLKDLFTDEQIQETKDKVASVANSINTMKNYAIGEGYNLVAAIKDKIPDDILKNLFTDNQIADAKLVLQATPLGGFQTPQKYIPPTKEQLQGIDWSTASVLGYSTILPSATQTETLTTGGTSQYIPSSPTDLENYLKKASSITGLSELKILSDSFTFKGIKRMNPDLYNEGVALITRYNNEGAAKDKAGVVAPVSAEQYVADFMSSRGLEPLSLIGVTLNKERNLVQKIAQHEYKKQYGTMELGVSRLESAATLLFEPARVLYPEVIVSDIETREWIIGGAQIALLAAPGFGAIAGRAVSPLAGVITSKSIQAAAGIVFAQDTIRNWNDMTPQQRAIDVAMDVWIVGSVLGGVKGLRAANAGKPTPKRVLPLSDIKMPTPIEAKEVINLAKQSGKAYKDLKSTTTSLNRILFSKVPNITKYTKAVNKVEQAIAKSLGADKTLFEKFENLKSITAKEIKQLEKYSKIPNIGEGIKNINTTLANINKAWAKVEVANAKMTQYIDALNQKAKVTAKQLKTAENLRAKYLDSLKGLDAAKTKYNIAIDEWGNKITRPRYRMGTAPSDTEVINALEQKLAYAKTNNEKLISHVQSALEAEERHLAHPLASVADMAGVKSEIDYLKAEIRRLRAEPETLATDLKRYRDMMARGEPLPAQAKEYYRLSSEVVGVMETEPKIGGEGWGKGGKMTKEEYDKLFGKMKEGRQEPKSWAITERTPEIKSGIQAQVSEIRTKAKDLVSSERPLVAQELERQKPQQITALAEPKIGEQRMLFDLKIEPAPQVIEFPTIPKEYPSVPKISEFAEMPEIKPATQQVGLSIASEPKVNLVIRPSLQGQTGIGAYPEVIVSIPTAFSISEKSMSKITQATQNISPETWNALSPQAQEAVFKELISISQIDPQSSEFTLIDFATQSLTGIENKIQNEMRTQGMVESITKALIESAPMSLTELQVKNLTKTLTKTQIPPRTPPAITTTTTTKPPIIKLPLPTGKSLDLTSKEFDSLIAWKMGIMYKMIWSPYGKAQRYNSRQPIEGVEYAEGIGSAQRSAIAKGLPPDVLDWEMGIVQIDFTGMKDGKPDMKFEQTAKAKSYKRKQVQREAMPTIGVIR